jgi:hypothetical protein
MPNHKVRVFQYLNKFLGALEGKRRPTSPFKFASKRLDRVWHCKKNSVEVRSS